MSDMNDAIDLFAKKFKGNHPELAVFAPGRVNLIGEHVDYNMGFVLPFALPFRTVIVGRRSTHTETRIFSSLMDAETEPCSFVIDSSLSKGEPEWANYGTIYQYLVDLPDGAAFDAVILSDVPVGSGLSSSAALEVATATFLEKLFNLAVDPVTKARRCQTAEHTFAGPKITSLSLSDLENSRPTGGNLLQRSHLCKKPFCSPVILLTNSNVKHSLSGSEYPVRVKQCQDALGTIQASFPQVKSLRDATLTMLQTVKGSMTEVIYRRARHCITGPLARHRLGQAPQSNLYVPSLSENERTLVTVDALKTGDFHTVGIMMTQSHLSLRDDYEVSCVELDTLVDLALQIPGVLGSRMTGGGFGGCTVTLVKKDSVHKLKAFLYENYPKAHKIDCVCYEAVPSSGAGSLDLRKVEKKSTASTWFALSAAIVVVGVAIMVGIGIVPRRR